MTTERATKAVDRLEAIGLAENLGEYYSRDMMIRRFEQIDESELDPNYIKALDMSDFKFRLEAPILRAIVNAAIKQNRKAIIRNLEKLDKAR